jgi:glycosyltransferase involved in cell wall biosynthesis
MMHSILINNYNYGRFLRECIDSVLAQDHPDFEVVVVDDGSTDDSHAIIASYGDAIVPVLKANGGQASSFNAGLAAARGDILLLLDADDAFLPGKLRHIDALYAAHDLDWCFDRVAMEPDFAPPTEPQVTLVDKRAAMRAGGFPSLPVPTSGLSFRRAVLEQILPMPVASGVVLSDNYLKFAAAYLGKGAIVDTPLTFQRIHEANRYTNSGRAKSLKPQIMIATGLHLARRYDGLGRMGQSLVAGGIAGSGLSLGATWREVGRCAAEARDLGWSALGLGARVLRKKLAMAVRGGEA